LCPLACSAQRQLPLSAPLTPLPCRDGERGITGRRLRRHVVGESRWERLTSLKLQSFIKSRRRHVLDGDSLMQSARLSAACSITLCGHNWIWQTDTGQFLPQTENVFLFKATAPSDCCFGALCITFYLLTYFQPKCFFGHCCFTSLHYTV